MTRPKLNTGDLVIVRNLYESPLHKYGVFKLGDRGIVKKVTGDIVHLEVNGEPKKINIYNVKKWRKYEKRKK
jgi:hypothetical protein